MDRAKARKIASAIDKAMAAIAAQFNVAIAPCRGRFNTTTYATRLSVTDATSTTGQLLSSEAINFTRKAKWLYNLPPDLLGRSFNFEGVPHTISGLTSRRSRHPVIATRSTDGRSYRFSVTTIREDRKSVV